MVGLLFHHFICFMLRFRQHTKLGVAGYWGWIIRYGVHSPVQPSQEPSIKLIVLLGRANLAAFHYTLPNAKLRRPLGL